MCAWGGRHCAVISYPRADATSARSLGPVRNAYGFTRPVPIAFRIACSRPVPPRAGPVGAPPRRGSLALALGLAVEVPPRGEIPTQTHKHNRTGAFTLLKPHYNSPTSYAHYYMYRM